MRDLAATLLPLTGTPTAIWRRTGEILAVGAEFCILTEWSQQDLIFRDTEDVPLAERGATAGGGNMKDGFEGWKGCFCWEVMEKQRSVRLVAAKLATRRLTPPPPLPPLGQRHRVLRQF